MSNLVPRKLFNSLLPRRDDLFYPFQSIFDRLYEEMTTLDANTLKSKLNYPRWDVYETEGQYTVQASIPGMESEDVSVEVLPDQGQGRLLKVAGRVNDDWKLDDVKYHVRELRRSSFERYCLLPSYVRGDPEAELEDGVLTLRWKIDEGTAPKPKLIPVKKKKNDNDQEIEQ